MTADDTFSEALAGHIDTPEFLGEGGDHALKNVDREGNWRFTEVEAVDLVHRAPRPDQQINWAEVARLRGLFYASAACRAANDVELDPQDTPVPQEKDQMAPYRYPIF